MGLGSFNDFKQLSSMVYVVAPIFPLLHIGYLCKEKHSSRKYYTNLDQNNLNRVKEGLEALGPV